MSYILDALKKADAERTRERSAVPGLDAQPGAALGPGDSRRGSGPVMRLVAIGGLALVAAGLAWFAPWSRDEPAPFASTPVASTPVAASHSPVPTPAAATAPPMAATTVPAPPPAPTAAKPAGTVAALVPPPATASAAQPPAAARIPAAAPVAPPVAKPTPVAAAVKTPRAPPPASKVPAPAEAEAKLPTMSQLPAGLRAALPPLSVSGAVYAPQPSGRMVFLNGQVLREGGVVAEGLTVERIGPDATVLAFRGTRFQLKH